MNYKYDRSSYVCLLLEFKYFFMMDPRFMMLEKQ